MGSPTPLSRTVTVLNPEGLHLRPADRLVRAASSFSANIQIGHSGEMVDCKSILSLMTLGAVQGTELSLVIQGDDANEAMSEICELFETSFHEDGPAENAPSLAD